MLYRNAKVILVASITLSSMVVLAAKVSDPKCKDFVEVKEKFTPEYMAFVDGYDKRGKTPEDHIDVAGIVTESAKVKEECIKDKNAKLETVRKNVKEVVTKTIPPKNTLQGDIDRKSGANFNPIKANCTDFISLGEEYQPVAAFWVAGHTKSGKITNGEIDGEYLERPVATLVQECREQPTASFYDKAKVWFKNHI